MRGGQGRAQIDEARRMPAFEMADHGGAEGLVDGDPLGHHVAEAIEHRLGVVTEVADHGAAGPAAPVLQWLRQVPVVERDHRLDTPGVQAVHQPPVEVEALLADRPGAVGDDPRPRDGEPVGGQAQLREQIEVFLEPVIVIAGDVTGVAVCHRAGHPAECVPDRPSPAVFVRGALDLVRGGRRAEEEPGRKAHGQCRLLLHCASDGASTTARLSDGHSGGTARRGSSCCAPQGSSDAAARSYFSTYVKT